MGKRVFEYDWAHTPLGPIHDWDESIRSAVTMTIRSEFPMFVFVGNDLVQIYNDAAIAFMTGKHPDESFARPWIEVWAEVAERLQGLLMESIESDTSLIIENAFLPIMRNGRIEEAYITFSYSPLRDASGMFSGVHCITLENTASVLATRRFDVIQQVVHASEAQPFLDACRRVAAILANNVGEAPFSAFYRYDGTATAKRVAASGAPASERFFPLELRNDPVEGWPIENLAADRPTWVRFPRGELGDPPLHAWSDAVEQAAIVPIVVAKKAIGFIIVGLNPRTRLTSEYTSFLVAIATEMSTALTSTAVHASERFESARELRASQSFQDASLPRTLPVVPGLTFDAIYVPASDEAKVGGDWYDAARLADGRIVISIGDVAGHGLLAAVIMGNIRQIIRGIAQVHADPAFMLEAADRALRLEHPETCITAWVGVIDLVGQSLTFASAGHPPPFIRMSDGRVEQLPLGGIPLGIRRDTAERARVMPLPEGSTLCLYTDGLTEAWRDVVAGEKQLAQALAIADGTKHAAKDVHASVLGGARATDDVAILTVHVASYTDGARAYLAWGFEASDAAAAMKSRCEIREVLAQRGWSVTDIDDAAVVFGELVANVVRHAPGHVHIVLDMSLADPVLHVLDRGPGFEHVTRLPRDVYSEFGRGLFIVDKLARDMLIRQRVGGGSHASVTLAKKPLGGSHAWDAIATKGRESVER